jgi:hypothetical protein
MCSFIMIYSIMLRSFLQAGILPFNHDAKTNYPCCVKILMSLSIDNVDQEKEDQNESPKRFF